MTNDRLHGILRELRAELEKIEKTIAMLENLAASGVAPPKSPSPRRRKRR